MQNNKYKQEWPVYVEARGRADADAFSANVAKLRKSEGEREKRIFQ